MSSHDYAPVRVGWYGVALLVLGTYAVIIAPSERRLAEIASRSRELYELSQRNDRYVANLASLESARRRVEGDVERLKGNSGAIPSVAILAVLGREAKAHHISIASIASEQSPTAVGDVAGDDLRITLQGRYRDIIALVTDLPAHEALVDVRSISLEKAGGVQSLFPLVNATVRVTIYHSPWNLVKEDDRAATR